MHKGAEQIDKIVLTTLAIVGSDREGCFQGLWASCLYIFSIYSSMVQVRRLSTGKKFLLEYQHQPADIQFMQLQRLNQRFLITHLERRQLF